jgi:predicted alpha/beta superfamily hydrolase
MCAVVAALAVATGCSRSSNPGPGSAARPAPPVTAADSGPGAVVIGERMGLRSDILGEDRILLVYRPQVADAKARFPVLYLLDGEAHFHHVTGIVDFLISQGLMPPVIVVGLGNIDRVRDFTPTGRADLPTSGAADRFLVFLAKELIPAVEAKFPVARYRILVGHSLGGLFAVHAMTRMPDLFDAVISISPSLAWVGDPIRSRTEALLAARPELDRALYVAVGGEPPEMMESNRAFAAMLRQRAPRTFRWMFEELPAEDHGSVVHRAVLRGLEHVFAGWRPPAADTLAALDAHYQALSVRFRMVVIPSEKTLNGLGYRLLAVGKLDAAIEALRRNAEVHPQSANVHDSLGEALERKGDRAAAVKSYELAVKNAALNADPQLDLYRARLERARAGKSGP